MNIELLMRIVAGIDGGGTRTQAVLMAEDGTILGRGLGRGEGGASNIHQVGPAAAKRNIRAAYQRAWRQAGHKARPCAAVFLGMAGVSSESERRIIHRIARELNLAPAKHIQVDHDIRIALAGGLGGREGIVVIAGTGSACYGRRADGGCWQAGGWGSLLDDVGSGYFLGLQAMIAAARAADGRGKPTALSGMLMRKLKLGSLRELIVRLHGRAVERLPPLSRAEIAALAPLVVQAAERGDKAAREIIERGAEELALMARTVARKLKFPPPVLVVVCGGLAEAAPFFKKRLRAALRRRLPKCELAEPLFPPAVGAAVEALQSLHREIARHA